MRIFEFAENKHLIRVMKTDVRYVNIRKNPFVNGKLSYCAVGKVFPRLLNRSITIFLPVFFFFTSREMFGKFIIISGKNMY